MDEHPTHFPAGDMPGDKIGIDESHINRAETIFPYLETYLKGRGTLKTLVSVFGGSGAGKSEIGSILAHHCRNAGYETYLLSGDNYSHRYPALNDMERLNRFRSAGWIAIAGDENSGSEWSDTVFHLIAGGMDADMGKGREHPGIRSYQQAGRRALIDYLGSPVEMDFNALNRIIGFFKERKGVIPLKRMGRTSLDIRFDAISFSTVQVMIIEWTHGNSPYLEGIDFPIFLHSTQENTSEHRRSRGRDKNTGSHFTRLVLDIEQSMVNSHAENARIIITQDGAVVDYDQMGKYRI